MSPAEEKIHKLDEKVVFTRFPGILELLFYLESVQNLH